MRIPLQPDIRTGYTNIIKGQMSNIAPIANFDRYSSGWPVQGSTIVLRQHIPVVAVPGDPFLALAGASPYGRLGGGSSIEGKFGLLSSSRTRHMKRPRWGGRPCVPGAILGRG